MFISNVALAWGRHQLMQRSAVAQWVGLGFRAPSLLGPKPLSCDNNSSDSVLTRHGRSVPGVPSKQSHANTARDVLI